MAVPTRNILIKDEHLARVLAGEDFLVEDGAMGTMLQKRKLVEPGDVPELLNITKPLEIQAIHRAYVEAGAEMVTTNTFGANALKLEGAASVEDVFAAATQNARAAGARYVGGNIGPTGALLEPLGTLSFEDAYELFAQQVRAAVAAGCDLIAIETMADLREAKAAVLAACENCDLPVFVSMTFGEDGRTFLGTPPEIAAATLSALGASAVGVNCSLGPNELVDVAWRMARFSRVPLIVRPNAGLPRIVDGETVYDVSPQAFAQDMARILEAGVGIVGGCCGTSPEFIAQVRDLVVGKRPQVRPYKESFVVASAQEMVSMPAGKPQVAVIGERINPTGKKKLKAALRARDYDYVVAEAVAQQRAGADVLDVNAGLPDIDEPTVLCEMVEVLQTTVTLPLQVDSSDPAAIEAAVRGYAGKPLINSVSGKRASLEAVLPLAKRYGCALVGLTLDDEGIPPTAEGRLAVARCIVEEAERVGIPRCDVAIDCLVMAAATNQAEIGEVLRAVTLVKQQLGVRTVLGVSNVSFGMPQRNLINATFLAAALGAGLDMPILNPLAQRYRDAVAVFRVLNGQDAGAAQFVAGYAQASDPYDAPVAPQTEGARTAPGELAAGAAQPGGASAASGGQGAGALAGGVACAIEVTAAFADAPEAVCEVVDLVLAGRAAPIAAATEALLREHDALDVVNDVFVPVLDVVGMRYDAGEFFLPQLMASAEAVKVGFDVVRERVQGFGAPDENALRSIGEGVGEEAASAQAAAPSAPGSSRAIVVATVEGDIHDIGKNIVKMLLENYGFPVVDLGRDVSPECVVRAARECGARLVGLSALMTTTVKAMERTIELVHRELPDVLVMVGGAVLTADYAREIGADFYAKDAAESARIATRFFAE